MSFLKLLFFFVISPASLLAGSVIITAIPDPSRPLTPLTSLDGTTLEVGSEIRIGALPNLTADQVLDLAASGGLATITTSFTQFGETTTIGSGVDNSSGSFEILARQNTNLPPSNWIGEKITILITRTDSDEFLLAQFPDQVFQEDPEVGLEPLVALHMADAQLIVGNRYGNFSFVSSPAPTQGSFSTWITSFDTLLDPAQRLPDADPDLDGQSNLFEYYTAGNPTSFDPSAGRIVKDTEDDTWFRVSRVAGIGVIQFTVETSPDLQGIWTPLTGQLIPVPASPTESPISNLVQIRIPDTLNSESFYRLKISTEDD